MNLDNQLIVIKTSKSKYLAVIDIEKEFITNEGKFSFSTINKIPSKIISSTGVEFKIYHPTYKEFILLMKRGPQIIYPKDIGQIILEADINHNSNVLEIGTGSGYQAAVLVEMGLKVFSIERQKDLFDFSKNILMKLGYNITQKFGDGYKGIPSYAPFDGIIVTAAAPDVPTHLLEQLSPDGSLIIPMGKPDNDQVMKRIKKSTISEGYEEEDLGSFRFVPMLKDIDSGDGF